MRTHPALVAALGALVIVWGGLVATHSAPRLAVPRGVALQHVLAEPAVARMLRTIRWTRWDVTPIDGHNEVLGFYRGARMVANVNVANNRGIVVSDATDLARTQDRYGSNIANDVRLLGLLAAVSFLMTAVWPLSRIRNLDVLVVASLAMSVVLFNDGRLNEMVLVSYPALIYLALRCAWWALGRRREPSPAVPLYDHLTRKWGTSRQVRMLRFVALASGVVLVMVGLSSLNVVDVGYAVMEGATAIVHGMLPYGHIPAVLHGDTYPIGSYLLYVPFAWVSPVHSVWDDADLTLVVAVVAALLTAAGLSRIATRSDPNAVGERDYAAHSAGLRTAIAVLTFPPLLVTVSSGTTDVALAAILVAALLLWRRPGWGMAALSGAAWFKLAPLAIIPLFVARLRGRALVYAGLALAVTSLTMLAVLFALGGVDAPGRMLSAISFQFTRSSPHTLWAVVGSVPLQQLAEAATVALVVGASVQIGRHRALADDRRRFAAIAAAVLLGMQISANYWSFLYLVWIVPFLLVSIFGRGSSSAGFAPRGPGKSKLHRPREVTRPA